MRKQLLCIICLLVQFMFLIAQRSYQLAPPFAVYNSAFFEKSTQLKLEFRQPGGAIHFTTDGTEPTEQSAIYKKPIEIKGQYSVVKARCFANGFLASETTTLQFFGSGIPMEVISTSPPNEKYKGSGSRALMDNQSGSTQPGHLAWLGFDSDSIIIDLGLKKVELISKLMLHILHNQPAWIFPPQRIRVLNLAAKENTVLADQNMETVQQASSEANALFLAIPPVHTQSLRLVLYPLASLPSWHTGSGSKAWLFIDEIKLY